MNIKLMIMSSGILLFLTLLFSCQNIEEQSEVKESTIIEKISIEQRPLKPTLPLPVITSETNRIKQASEDYLKWSSVRAWHYNPGMAQALWDVWESFTKPPLSMRMKIMLATVSDSRNKCPYCLSSVVCFLIQDGVSEKNILALQTDINNSDFSDKEKTLLLLAENITVDPSSSSQYVGYALEAGWREEEVAQAIFVVSYFNMLNRISEAFAFPPDQEHPFVPGSSFPFTNCKQYEE